jgi:hypothetical protein
MTSLTPQRCLVVSVLVLIVALLGISAAAYAQGQAGTTLTVTKTATGFYERRIQYTWTLKKSVTPQVGGELAVGATQQVTYTIETTRVPHQLDIFGVRGDICVTNGGTRPTEGLTIMDAVQSKPQGPGQFEDVLVQPVGLGDFPQLAAGQSHCYPYEITTTGPIFPNRVRRNQARVTITNHSGSLGIPTGPSPNADFTLPTTPTITETDESAMVTDVEQCPAGFTCTPSNRGPFLFTASGSVSFTKAITNVNAVCDGDFALTNIATLTTNDTPGALQSNDVSLTGISTPDCPPIPPSIVGCTHTRGFWINHPEAWPVTTLTLGTVPYTQAQLLQILDQPTMGNGLVQLASQLIAAKLNVATKATTSAGVANDITSADLLIGDLVVPPVGTGYLAPGQTSSLIASLDEYNNGDDEGSAPHCGE